MTPRAMSKLSLRIATIDLGTNSVRFDVHSLRGGLKKPKRLHRERVMVRLGQGVFLSGHLHRQAKHRTECAFKKFRKIMAHHNVSEVMALGTSALRESIDARSFVEGLRRKTGIDLKIISGTEEARLTALGIIANERVPSKRFAMVDIGGGSTEISICSGRRVAKSSSFLLGTARLQQLFIDSLPIAASRLGEMRSIIRLALKKRGAESLWPEAKSVIGSSGTVRAIARLLRPKKFKKKPIELKELSRLVRSMNKKTRPELIKMRRMDAKRVDSIVAGAILLEECMFALRAKKFRATDFSLRDGMLAEAMMRLKRKRFLD